MNISHSWWQEQDEHWWILLDKEWIVPMDFLALATAGAATGATGADLAIWEKRNDSDGDLGDF